MNVLIAPDKFKGSFSALEVAGAIAEGLLKHDKNIRTVILPIADGGEGTAEILTTASGGQFQRVRAADPLFRQVHCQYGISADGSTAFIDLAEASGLRRLQPHEIDAMRASTIGTGELIAHAIRRKCRRIVIGLGGSATMDAGIGIAHALGIRFMDEDRRVVAPLGRHLRKIEYIDTSSLLLRPGKVELLLLADVQSPLLGPDGAMLFAKQKGVPPGEMETVSDGLAHFANLLEAEYGFNTKLPSMGAAGGAALAPSAMLGAALAPGADFVMQALDFDAAIAAADLVITGEGMLDAQTVLGKAVSAVASAAQAQGKQCAAIVGQDALDTQAQRTMGLDMVLPLYNKGRYPAGNLGAARKRIVKKTRELMEALAPKLGK